jgi:hypothetical protein
VTTRFERAPLTRILLPSFPLLALAALAMVYDTPIPTLEKLVLAALAVGAVAAGALLRLARVAPLREVAPAPLIAVLAATAAATPVAILPELLAGVTGVLVIVWLADDPLGPADSASRALLLWGIPAVGLGLAWASATLLPTSAAPVGVAGALLVAALVILAYLVRRPELFDRDVAATV